MELVSCGTPFLAMRLLVSCHFRASQPMSTWSRLAVTIRHSRLTSTLMTPIEPMSRWICLRCLCRSKITICPRQRLLRAPPRPKSLENRVTLQCDSTPQQRQKCRTSVSKSTLRLQAVVRLSAPAVPLCMTTPCWLITSRLIRIIHQLVQAGFELHRGTCRRTLESFPSMTRPLKIWR